MDVQITDNSAAFIDAKDLAIQRALEIIGLKAEKYAKARCPVGTPESTGIPGYKGGTLKKSISHDRDKDSAYVGTNVKYAKYVEFGTVKMKAKPYLKPAIQDHIDEYQAIVKNELKG